MAHSETLIRAAKQADKNCNDRIRKLYTRTVDLLENLSGERYENLVTPYGGAFLELGNLYGPCCKKEFGDRLGKALGDFRAGHQPIEVIRDLYAHAAKMRSERDKDLADIMMPTHLTGAPAVSGDFPRNGVRGLNGQKRTWNYENRGEGREDFGHSR